MYIWSLYAQQNMICDKIAFLIYIIKCMWVSVPSEYAISNKIEALWCTCHFYVPQYIIQNTIIWNKETPKIILCIFIRQTVTLKQSWNRIDLDLSVYQKCIKATISNDEPLYKSRSFASEKIGKTLYLFRRRKC